MVLGRSDTLDYLDLVLDLVDDLLLHLQCVGGDAVDLDVVVPQRLEEAVDGSSVLQVAHHTDGESVDAALGVLDAVEVQHGLGGVLLGAAASVDVEYTAYLDCAQGGVVVGVPHDDDVPVVHHCACGILEALAILGAAGHGVGHGSDVPAEPEHGGLEAEACPGAGLEEEADRDLSPCNV